MSIIKERDRYKQNKTSVIIARVDPSLKARFEKHCRRLGVSMTEAVRELIEYELTPVKDRERDAGDAIAPHTIKAPAPVAAEAYADLFPVIMGKDALKPFIFERGGKKFLPCPICRTYTNYANFRRDHVIKHNYDTPADLFNDMSHRAELLELLSERDREQST